MKHLSKTELAIMNATTVFSKTVKDINNGLGKTENLIKKSTNIKLGKKVTKGIYKGMPKNYKDAGLSDLSKSFYKKAVDDGDGELFISELIKKN